MAEEIRWEEAMLEELGRAVTYPATPDLRASVLSRITVGRPAPSARPAGWRLAAGALSVLVVAFFATLVVSRDARDAVADFLGLAVEGERIEILPTPTGGQTATPFPPPVRLEQMAEKVTRGEAVRRAGFEPVLPASLGEPDAYYLLPVNSRAVLIADYGDVQIWEFPLESGLFIGKGIFDGGGGNPVAEVTVNGTPGYWIQGGARIVTVRDADGTTRSGTQRTVLTQALIWSERGIYRRIEGTTDREGALALATEMR